MLPIAQAADWFKETGYQNPVDPRRGMLQAAHHTDLPIFAWLAAPENKELWDNANSFFRDNWRKSFLAELVPG